MLGFFFIFYSTHFIFKSKKLLIKKKQQQFFLQKTIACFDEEIFVSNKRLRRFSYFYLKKKKLDGDSIQVLSLKYFTFLLRYLFLLVKTTSIHKAKI